MAKASLSISLFPSTFGFSIGRPNNSAQTHVCVPRCSQQPSSSPLARTLAEIQSSGVIACLRAQSGELAMQAARAALSGGISVLEIVMSTPGVFEVLQGLVQDHPTSIIGVGTVLNAKDAENAVKAGAKFLMSPAMVKDILYDFQGGEVLYIPGVMTPTEVLTAYNAGARIVKVYPVSALGGAQYISALKKPFPHIPMVASQGITIDSLGAYIAGGASAVVLSDAIFVKEAIGQQNFDAIYQLAQLATLRGDEAVQRKQQLYVTDYQSEEARKLDYKMMKRSQSSSFVQSPLSKQNYRGYIVGLKVECSHSVSPLKAEVKGDNSCWQVGFMSYQIKGIQLYGPT